MQGREGEYAAAMRHHVQEVREKIEAVQPLSAEASVLEVGSGAHGLIFYFGARCGVGIDPLAVHYAALFPAWQRRTPTIAAHGEALPFADGTFDLVLCDNVIDHAADPGQIVREMARVLRPGGLLYLTVNFHHPVYQVLAAAHALWNAAGLRLEVGPFADHTRHFTLGRARRLFAGLPLRFLTETHDIAASKELARRRPPRHLGDRLKRIFFKNALYEVVAVREP